MSNENRRPRDRVTPREILSFVEDEMGVGAGDGSAARMTPEERAAVRARIRSHAADFARYERLRSSVEALRSLPPMDAPAAVWDRIEARFEETLESGAAVRGVPSIRAIRSAPTIWRVRIQRRLARTAMAAACLLAAVIGVLWVAGRGPFGGGGDDRPAPSGRILFVKAEPKASGRTASMAVAEFLTKVTRRYHGVSSEELDEILRLPPGES